LIAKGNSLESCALSGQTDQMFGEKKHKGTLWRQREVAGVKPHCRGFADKCASYIMEKAFLKSIRLCKRGGEQGLGGVTRPAGWE